MILHLNAMYGAGQSSAAAFGLRDICFGRCRPITTHSGKCEYTNNLRYRTVSGDFVAFDRGILRALNSNRNKVGTLLL